MGGPIPGSPQTRYTHILLARPQFLQTAVILGGKPPIPQLTLLLDRFQVTLSGAVEGKAVWPSHLKPVAWHEDADRVRMKLGLYHKIDEVHDGMVEYRDISIQGPNGKFGSIKAFLLLLPLRPTLLVVFVVACFKHARLTTTLQEETGLIFFFRKKQSIAGKISTARDTESAGHLYLGCFKDQMDKRALSGKKYVDAHMTAKVGAPNRMHAFTDKS